MTQIIKMKQLITFSVPFAEGKTLPSTFVYCHLPYKQTKQKSNRLNWLLSIASTTLAGMFS